MEDSLNNSTSHKGEKRRNYTMEFKREAICYAENHSNRKAADKFKVAVKRIREWRQNKSIIFESTTKPKNKRLKGGGRKVLDVQLENQLVEWIYDRRSKGLRVSRKQIMMKGKYLYEDGCEESERSLFVASNGWLCNFMSRNGLSLRRKTTTAQQDPDRLIDKIISYILHVRRLSIKFNYQPSNIIAMDETPVWNDMVSSTTVDKKGAKSICLKTTGHEKCMVTVCLAAKADGTKLKPFVVFRAAKRESKSLDDEFKARCVITTSANAWMNEDLTLTWVKRVLGAFSFSRRLFAWDSFECHMTDEVRKKLKEVNVDLVIIPGGCTKYVQAPDVSWNKPFKTRVTELYDQWLSEGVHEYTVGGNIKAPSRKKIVEWIIDAWSQLSEESIIKSFKCCGLNLANDGTEDDQIHCLKKGQPCDAGREKLSSQLSVLSDEDQGNPFISLSDAEDAAEEMHMIDSDDDILDV